MKKITIIGGGNMGGAIARGLVRSGKVTASDITVSDTSPLVQQRLKNELHGIYTTADNLSAVRDADIVIFAVKPWLMESVVTAISDAIRDKTIISIAAGISLDQLEQWIGKTPLFRLIPNTAISEGESMTLIASRHAGETEASISELFGALGMVLSMPEEKIPAGTALTSCGIAFVLKYIQAAMQAGIEMGVYPKDAMRMVAQSVKGAAELILNHDTHPAQEIDKVTTPGGITIRGINELDHAGFTSAIIQAMKKCL
ncbi:MAG: pyrroline-5-carboxylate reductase [Prevotellaceae bacterium]|jgi:pyrroline-5-carboxylate reductase|nr:pyrroline-5-carboxylate reductase [Prevotellaceae bacterium]